MKKGLNFGIFNRAPHRLAADSFFEFDMVQTKVRSELETDIYHSWPADELPSRHISPPTNTSIDSSLSTLAQIDAVLCSE